jgi:hypothetical protein
MTPIKVFFLEPTDRERMWLRRYRSSAEHKCAETRSYCNAMFDFGECDIRYTDKGERTIAHRAELEPPHSDPRWPTKCEACGEPFAEKDPFQLFTRQIYVNLERGLRTTLDDAPPGACWDAWWMSDRAERHDLRPGVGSNIGPDGRCLIVKCPDGHDWMIDSRASNCTRRDDNEHHCWVRHGRPEDGTLHVDKNGNTCAAGAGSILTPKWHGFLRNGYLTD